MLPSEDRKTILDLPDDCFSVICDYLGVKDSLALAITCTRLQKFTQQRLPSKYSEIDIEVDVSHWVSNSKCMYRELVNCILDFPNIRFTFDYDEHYIYSENIFKLMCQYRTRPMNRLTVANLQLPNRMPPSMLEFFRRTPVEELDLWHCYFPGRALFPNVQRLLIDPNLIANGNASLTIDKLPDGGFTTLLEVQTPERVIPSHNVDFRSTRPHMEPIECKTLFMRSDLTELNYEPHQLENMKKLVIQLVHNNDGQFSDDILKLFSESSVDCVWINIDPDVRFTNPKLFLPLAHLNNLRTIQLVDQFKGVSNLGLWAEGLMPLRDQTPKVEEIEFCTFISTITNLRSLYERYLDTCKSKHKKIVLSFKTYRGKTSSENQMIDDYSQKNQEYLELKSVKLNVDKHIYLHKYIN